MDKIIKIPVDAGKVTISEDTKSILRNLFSGCRVNFLFGAGFSANLLGTLSNNEVIFGPLISRFENRVKRVKRLFKICDNPPVDWLAIYSLVDVNVEFKKMQLICQTMLGCSVNIFLQASVQYCICIF